MSQSTKNNKKQNKQNKKDKQSQKKKIVSKRRSTVCPYVIGIFILLGAIGGIIGYDVHLNDGIFEKSTTGKFLKDTGALPYVELAWYKSMSNSARAYQWLEKNVPIYYTIGRETLKPYIGLMCDLSKVGWGAIKNFGESISELCSRKAPIVADFVDQYVPGLSKKVQELSSSAWSSSVYVYHSSCDFFKTKIFIGSFSSESLSKVMNQTQIVAAEYYSWFHNKVDEYAKIK